MYWIGFLAVSVWASRSDNVSRETSRGSIVRGQGFVLCPPEDKGKRSTDTDVKGAFVL